MTAVRLRHLAANVIERSDGATCDFVGLEHVEAGTGRVAWANVEPKVAFDAIRFRSGDVLFGKLRPYLAKSFLADRDATATGELLVLRARSDVDAHFLSWVVMSQPFLDWAVTTSYGTKMPRTSWEALSDFKVDLPHIDRQRRISAFLDDETARIDRLIDLRLRQSQALVARLDAHAASAIIGAESVSLPMRRVMARWIDYRGATPIKSTSGVRLITASNIKNGAITFEQSEEFIPEEDYGAWMRRGLPKHGDVLLTTEAPLGETAQIEATDVALAQRIILLRPDAARCLPRWLYWWLRSPLGRAAVRAHATGSTALGIKADRLRAIPMPLPDLGVQARVVSELDWWQAATLRKQPLLARQVALLRERRMSLITAALMGDFDVTTVRGAS